MKIRYKYILIIGYGDEFCKVVEQQLNIGWEIQGNLVVKSNGEYVQPMIARLIDEDSKKIDEK